MFKINKVQKKIYKKKFDINIKKLLNNSTLIKIITIFIIKLNLLLQFRNYIAKSLSKFQNTKSLFFKQTLEKSFEILSFDSIFSKFD